MKMKGIMFLLVLFCIKLVLGSESDLENEVHSRVKRQFGGGGDACLQIYSVPKKSVKCEPTNEVVDALTDLRGITDSQKGLIDEINARIDTIDPDKKQELPDEVKEKLNTIDQVKETQAGHGENLKGIENEIGHLVTRIEGVEAADRTEVARLIELQSQLIQMTIKQGNATLHDKYIDRLTESTRDLTDKLRTLEDELKDTIENAEKELSDEVKKTEEQGKIKVQQLNVEMNEKFNDVEKKLLEEMLTRYKYQNKTVLAEAAVAALQDITTNIQEHQARYEQHEAELRTQVEELDGELTVALQDNDQLTQQTASLTADLSKLYRNYEMLIKDLYECKNNTDTLRKDLNEVSATIKLREHLLPRTLKVTDCQEALIYYHPVSGIYPINPSHVSQPFDVYCEMQDTEGWTVIQRRQDGHVNFFLGWEEYKHGFGDLNTEYWIGLQNLYVMTNRKEYVLRIEMEDWEGKWYHAQYEEFRIDDEDHLYMLHVGKFSGDGGDSLEYHNGIPFSTMDKNHDSNNGICSTYGHGAWWYKDCFHSNLNGRYYTTGPYVTKTGWGDGVVWRHIKETNFYSLKSVVMKMKPK